MIITKQKVNDVETLVGDSDGFDMEISNDDMGYILNLLSNLYKDPFSIIPQEQLSNSWDSHVEANNIDEPIVCELKKDANDKWYFAARDFGVGISPERIKIFGSYGKSTKRQTNDYIGGWGIGAKSILSYTKTFYVDTVYNGIHYIYFISPNEFDIPHIELMSESKSDLSNQSKIWFYLKDDGSTYSYSRTEHRLFHDGIKSKTAYFKNIVYDFDDDLEDLNKYKLYEGKHFVYSEMEPFLNVHIIIENIPYEIDYESLGISSIRCPIGVKVKNVMPTPTREAYSITDAANKEILNAIKDAATEIVKLANKKQTGMTSWEEWLDTYKNRNNIKLLGDMPNDIYVYDMLEYSRIIREKPTLLALSGIDTSNISVVSALFPFYVTSIIKSGRRTSFKNALYYANESRYDTDSYRISNKKKFSVLKNRYISTDANKIYIWCKRKLSLRDYIRLLCLAYDDKVNWRKKITKYQKFVDSVWNEIPSYDDVVVPKEFKSDYKKQRYLKPVGYVTIYEIRGKLTHSYDADISIVGDATHVKDFNSKNYVIYGTKDDMPVFNSIYNVNNNNAVKFMYMAPSNFKYVEDKSQYIHIDSWKKSKVFSRIVTAYKIHKLLLKYNNIVEMTYHSENYLSGITQLKSEFGELVKELKIYKDKHINNYNVNFTRIETFLASCVDVANTNKLWDYSIYYKIDRLEDLCEKFNFVTIFQNNKNWVDMAANYIKYILKNIKLDLKWYQKSNQDI